VIRKEKQRKDQRLLLRINKTKMMKMIIRFKVISRKTKGKNNIKIKGINMQIKMHLML